MLLVSTITTACIQGIHDDSLELKLTVSTIPFYAYIGELA